jgi:hypothetical protein
MQLKTIQTKLETADRDEISAILDHKAMEVGAAQTTDYIGMAIENIESANNRIDQAIKELQSIKKDNISRIEIIKTGVSYWLSENGIEKLHGDRISSVSIYDKKPRHELIVTDEEAVINAGFFKMSVDKTAAKQAIIDGATFNGAHIETIQDEASIKINKKRSKNDDL